MDGSSWFVFVGGVMPGQYEVRIDKYRMMKSVRYLTGNSRESGLSRLHWKKLLI
jgi:hypothetical protein